MRFDRYPKCDRGTASPQRMAAARRAVERDRERCGLFPDMMKFKSAEQRVTAVLDDRVTWWRGMRDAQAKTWRRARREVRSMPELSRRGLMLYWQTCPGPGTPSYLLDMVTQWRRGLKCYWHELAAARRIALVGAGKMAAPWKRGAGEPLNL